jgi:hypothetical protein
VVAGTFEGKVPPQFLKHMKGKNGDEDEEDEGNGKNGNGSKRNGKNGKNEGLDESIKAGPNEFANAAPVARVAAREADKLARLLSDAGRTGKMQMATTIAVRFAAVLSEYQDMAERLKLSKTARMLNQVENVMSSEVHSVMG